MSSTCSVVSLATRPPASCATVRAAAAARDALFTSTDSEAVRMTCVAVTGSGLFGVPGLAAPSLASAAASPAASGLFCPPFCSPADSARLSEEPASLLSPAAPQPLSARTAVSSPAASAVRVRPPARLPVRVMGAACITVPPGRVIDSAGSTYGVVDRVA